MARTVLIIDDDSDFVEATSVLLEAKGFTVISAPNGAEGHAKAAAEKPDLLLLDVMMTYDSEGLDVATKLKQDPATRGIPVILITGIRRAMNLPFGFEADDDALPVKAVLEKPVKPELLLSTIEKALA